MHLGISLGSGGAPVAARCVSRPASWLIPCHRFFFGWMARRAVAFKKQEGRDVFGGTPNTAGGTPALPGIAILGLIFLLHFPALAENARLPYHHLYRIQKIQAELRQAHPNLQIALQLRSALPNVKTSDLEAYIDSKSGKIPLNISPDGDIAVPLRDDLLAEDPWLITNQPKGTMQLNWQAGLARSVVRQMTNSIHYGLVMRATRDCEDVQAKMRQFFPDAPKLVMSGLKLIFSPGTKPAALVIHAKSGDRKLEADAGGELIVPLDESLLEEDPLMTLSAPPAKVQLLSRKSEE